jgi:hypothetical protein
MHGTDELITCDEDMKRSILVIADLLLAPKLPQDGSVFDVPPVRQCFQPWNKAANLLLPIMKRGCRSYDKKWTPDIVNLRKVCEKRY